jgi:hypothetical protein
MISTQCPLSPSLLLHRTYDSEREREREREREQMSCRVNKEKHYRA